MKRTIIVLTGVLLMSSSIVRGADVYDTIRSGEQFSAEDVKIEEAGLAESPDDVTARTQLLGYYFGKQFADPAAGPAIAEHILWLIENKPESPVLGIPYGMLNAHMQPIAYEKGKALWLKHIEASREDVPILEHAARYFMQSDWELAERSLKKLKELEPINSKWPNELGQLYSLQMQGAQGAEKKGWATKAQKEYEEAYEKGSLIEKDSIRQNLAKVAFRAGDFEMAREQAESMLKISGFGWNSGNNIHYGNIILGHVALAEGAVDAASDYLINAGRTKGSPQLNSFGPNLTLAKALYEAGEKEAVLTYLDECSVFWEMDRGRLKKWSDAIKADEKNVFDKRIRF